MTNRPMMKMTGKTTDTVGMHQWQTGEKQGVRPLLELMKIPLCLHITLTAVVGYLLFRPVFSLDLFWLSLGIFLLAAGAATLNNLQDRFIDAAFDRTRHRAIPSGKIQPRTAAILGSTLILPGILLLYQAPTKLPLIMGLLAVALYNLVYTRLKPVTIYCIIPGALCGMLPPYIGWVYSGGTPFSLNILLIMLIIGLWQFPHYWIILMKYSADYRNQLQVPSMLNHFHFFRMRQTLFVWITAFACLTLLPIQYGLTTAPGSALMLAINAGLLVIVSFVILFQFKHRIGRFLHIYFSMTLTISLCIVAFDKVLLAG